MFLAILFILPLTVKSKITVNITVNSSSKNDISIKYYGDDKKIVTNAETKLFNITTENLKIGTKKELGKEPKDVFLLDPTNYGNIFQKYHWTPVKRSIKVHKAKIIDIITEDVVLRSHQYINNSTIVVKSKKQMFETIENTAQSLWSKSGIPEDDIYYHVDFNFTYGHFKYRNKYRSNNTHSARMSFGLDKKGDIFIKPYETVVTDLIATKVILIIELEYKAELVGAVVANFARLYGKYYFYAPSIKSVMRAAGMKNEFLTKEEIELRCFVNPRLEQVVKSVHEEKKARVRTTKKKKLKL